MIGSEWLCGALTWSSIDGEQFVGDQEQYFEDQDQQDYFEQEKYSMWSSLMSYSQLISHMHVSICYP